MRNNSNKRDWTPIQDTYRDYTLNIEKAIKDGSFDDYDNAQEIIWPWELSLADSEKEDINDFLLEVTQEIIKQSKSKGLTPKVVASFIFKTLITSMLFEQARVGR